MKKLILSRKGFDSGSGGKPSVILGDQMVSLPIPQVGTGIRYDQLVWESGRSYRELMNDLGIAPFEEAHLDPDLDRACLPKRPRGWKAAFGQQGAALSHLRGEGVEAGDVFLFFGWFRFGEKQGDGHIRYLKDSPELHVIYGFLEVGQIIDITTEVVPAWAKSHPHWVLREQMYPRNALFVAAEESSIWSGNAGAGLFPFSPELILTSQLDGNAKRSLWTLPVAFFDQDERCRLSYHRHKQGEFLADQNQYLLSSAYRGQEFVCERDGEVDEWLRGMIFK